MTIEITDAVVDRLKELIREQKVPEGTVLRLGVKGGGCSGFSYVVDFTQKVRLGDHVVTRDGVKVVVDSRSLPYLQGTRLDYKKTLMHQGFVFDNPNAKSGCGCGLSFDV